ncbi:MAG: hypothetical protein SNJ73_03825 [Acetobacteraceae bacterium]
MIRRRAVLASLPTLLAACEGGPVDSIVIPAGVFQGASDPLFQSAEIAFHLLVARPQALAGAPANAAYALLMYEIATVEAGSGRLSDRWPARLLREARPALRAASGLASEATAQQVVDALWAASQALRRGNEEAARAALSPPVATDAALARDRLQRLAVPTQVGRALRELRLALQREGDPSR